ncbi:glycine zipper 2TM domain-containing protein [Rhodanobacter sp. C01]|uniref:glycine zipper 2TM domain-containing protein n=1 Tax=Rhodanobacter sp. C01 TaxID=1945856 RepID=UPI000984F24C|nr:glycine zipper 2TM domain-containing protein [Rhodanobacter sp. C01]OOG50252.1 hypothetical protein B0E50_03755 [Rhodanobacter sp. C01]
MTKLWLSALVLAMLASSAYAQDARYPPPPGPPPPGAPPGSDDNAHYGWADVLRADPVQGVVRTNVPQQQCYDQQVVQHNPGNSAAGTVLGAVIGGVLGHTIGKGDGRTAATVGGAVVGGAVGNSVSNQGSNYQTTQTTCQQVNAVSEQRRIIGYDVEYRYRGEVYTSRLSYDPGERLRVRVQVDPAD